jgi:regulatory protein
LLNERIKEYAFLLLKYRLRSEGELYQRLKRKNFPEDDIRKTVAFLKEKKFLDDEVFTKAWISSRLGRSFGLKRIVRELKLKGIAKEVLEERIAQVKQDYCESRVIEELAKDKLSRLKNVEPVKARNRTYVYLIRRGFSSDAVVDTLNKICKQIY